jgi:C4-dicarboxylate-specific signal transduction histidine kinase
MQLRRWGPITDRVRALSVKSEIHDEGILITVKDTGPGSDPVNMDRIFDAFFSTKSHGMGWDFPSADRSLKAMVAAFGRRLVAPTAPFSI